MIFHDKCRKFEEKIMELEEILQVKEALINQMDENLKILENKVSELSAKIDSDKGRKPNEEID